MEIELFLLQLCLFKFFGIFYYSLFKKIKTVEEKSVFFFFFVFYFIGGGVTWFGYPFNDILYPSSGLNKINLTILHAIIYAKLIFLTPLIFCYIPLIFRNKSAEFIKKKTLNQKYLYLIFSTLIFMFILWKVDTSLFTPSYSNYSESIDFRYSLKYGFYIIFLGKSLLYFFSIGMLVFLFSVNDNSKLLYFLILVIIIITVDVFVFLSKLNLSFFLLSYIFLHLIFNKLRISSLFTILTIPLLYILYNIYSPSGYSSVYVIEPVIKALTRFTICAVYFIDYFLTAEFMMKPYFSTILGIDSYNPNDVIFRHMFSISTYGSTASGIIIYNYSNFGPFSIFISIFEFFVIYFLYNKIKCVFSYPLRISLLFLLLFGTLNYNFVTILINPLVFLVGFCFYFLFNKFLFTSLTINKNA